MCICSKTAVFQLSLVWGWAYTLQRTPKPQLDVPGTQALCTFNEVILPPMPSIESLLRVETPDFKTENLSLNTGFNHDVALVDDGRVIFMAKCIILLFFVLPCFFCSALLNGFDSAYSTLNLHNNCMNIFLFFTWRELFQFIIENCVDCRQIIQ